jgi:hypothetical protein
MSFLRLRDREAWTQCPGRPALEAIEGGRPEDVPKALPADHDYWANRKTALEGTGAAVEVHPLTRLEVGGITSEAGALGWGTVILATYADRSTLEVYPPDPVLALAAVLKYGILFEFASTNCGTPDELHVECAAITGAAALALSLKDSITALDHLSPGPYCSTCLAAYRCPKLKSKVHKTVYGELQAEGESDLVPVSLRARLAGDETMKDALEAAMRDIPAIEAWCAAVRAQAGLKRAKSPKTKPPRRKRGRPSKPGT